MIYVECSADEVLVRSLLGLQRREVRHEQKGKVEVIRRLSVSRRSKGLVDEDPGAFVPSYLLSMRLAQDLTPSGLKQYEDGLRENLVTVLSPRLEEWLITTTRNAGIEMRRYGLPDQGQRLHAVINEDPRKVERLVADLADAGSDRVINLRRLLQA